MEKYLFNDGTNVIREVQSREALNALLAGVSDKEKVSIWVYNSPEWISYETYTRLWPASEKKTDPRLPVNTEEKEARTGGRFRWLRHTIIGAVTLAGILLIYNFTRISWTPLEPVTITPERPENSPFVNMDSLAQVIEATRGQKLDKVTRTNLGIRNNWPDQVLLRVEANRDTSKAGIRYKDMVLTLDNATGYQLDEVVAKWTVWKNQKAMSTDTVRFEKINYTAPMQRFVEGDYRGDSLSVSVERIRSRAFSFCYAADKKSNSGNNNDRWFCR